MVVECQLNGGKQVMPIYLVLQLINTQVNKSGYKSCNLFASDDF